MSQLFTSAEKMTVDNKGRVGIPARFMAVLRAICPDQADRVGVLITPEQSIKIMPMPVYEEELARISQLNDQIDEERLILNLTASFAEDMVLDKQNRIKLNPLAMEICSIDRDVIIVGSIRYMQLFDEKRWREFYKRGLPQLGQAGTKVATQGEAPAPQQFVINLPQTGAGLGTAPGRS